MKTFEDYSIEELERFKTLYIIIMIVVAIIALMTTWAFFIIALFCLIPISNCNKCINEKKQKEIERKEAEHRAERERITGKVITHNTTPNSATTSLDCLSKYYDKSSPYYGSDLIESSDTPFVCSECAKYTKRWFSEFGKNPKYPKLPDYFKQHLKEHEDCALQFFPVLDNISIPAWDYKGNLVEFCNRPFIDSRTAEEKKVFEDYIADKERKAAIRAEYDWICKNLPEHAPKSLGGYTRMKNLNSENYQNIKKIALEQGKELV